MIAPIESMSKTQRVRSSGHAHTLAEKGESNSAEKLLQTAQQWVSEHPSAAIATSVAIGLLLGWAVKRRGS